MAAPPQLTSLNVEQASGLTKEQRELFEKLGGTLNPFLNDSVGALDRGLTFAENFKGQIRTVEFTMPDDWVALTFQNSFAMTADANFDDVAPAVRKARDGSGRVNFRGSITRGAAPASGTVICDSPYRAENRMQVAVNATGAFGALQINRDQIVYLSGTPTLISLDQLSTVAEDRTPPVLGAPFPKTVTLDRTFPGVPRYAVILLAEDVTSKNAPKPVAGVSIAFTPTVSNGVPAVSITDVQGCVALKAYRLTVLFLPE